MIFLGRIDHDNITNTGTSHSNDVITDACQFGAQARTRVHEAVSTRVQNVDILTLDLHLTLL